MMSCTFSGIKPCNLLRVNWCSVRSCGLHPQGCRVMQTARKDLLVAWIMMVSYLAYFSTLMMELTRWQVPSKYWLTFTRLHSVISIP
jgi:hypothetical protein